MHTLVSQAVQVGAFPGCLGHVSAFLSLNLFNYSHNLFEAFQAQLDAGQTITVRFLNYAHVERRHKGSKVVISGLDQFVTQETFDKTGPRMSSLHTIWLYIHM